MAAEGPTCVAVPSLCSVMLKEAAAAAEGTVRSALPKGAMKPSRTAMEELSWSSLLKANEKRKQ